MVDSHFNLIYDILPAAPPKKKEEKVKPAARLHSEADFEQKEAAPEQELPKGLKKRDKKLVRKVGSQ
jgi:hypothetical protein